MTSQESSAERSDAEPPRSHRKGTGEVLSEITSDLQQIFVNVYESVRLLSERGDILEDLEVKSELLAEQGKRLHPNQSRCLDVWTWLKERCAQIWSSAFCRALRGDSSMNKPLKLIK